MTLAGASGSQSAGISGAKPLASWNDYRKRVLIFYFSWLVFPLFVAVLDYIPVAHYWISRAGKYLWIFYFLLFWASSFRIILWRCPRCHKHFFMGRVLCDLLAKRCMNCHLPKWH